MFIEMEKSSITADSPAIYECIKTYFESCKQMWDSKAMSCPIYLKCDIFENNSINNDLSVLRQILIRCMLSYMLLMAVLCRRVASFRNCKGFNVLCFKKKCLYFGFSFKILVNTKYYKQVGARWISQGHHKLHRQCFAVGVQSLYYQKLYIQIWHDQL